MSDIQVNEYWNTRPVFNGKTRIKQLTSFINSRGYIAGSFAAWACTYLSDPWKPNDIDIFAKSDDAYHSLAVDLNKDSNYRFDAQNDITTTFSPMKPNKLGIQIIRPSPEWKTFPDDLINSFDLNVCRAVIISPVEVLCDEDAGEFYGKVLRINSPLRTFKRIMKYAARGVAFNDHELLKVFRAWDKMPTDKKEAWIAEAEEELLPDPDCCSDFTDEDDWFEGE